jgi:hypothetical protein
VLSVAPGRWSDMKRALISCAIRVVALTVSMPTFAIAREK